MREGDLVVLKSNIVLPGALTAINFFKRLKEEVGNSHMIVLKVHGNSVTVLVNGYKKVINSEFLKVVEE